MISKDVLQRDFPITNVLDECKQNGWNDIWFGAELCILVMGMLGNSLLLGLFLKERKSLSPSQVLGLNLVVMDFCFLSIMPFNLALQRNTHINGTMEENRKPIKMAKNFCNMFNVIGCPLLLTCMCVERYLAVMRPIMYLRMKKWEYRIAGGAVVWIITFSSCLLAVLVKTEVVPIIYVAIVISCLFSVMLNCFGGIMWSLMQQSPAHTNHGNQQPADRSLRRQAMHNVLVVLMAAVMAYLPVLIMLPVVFYIFFAHPQPTSILCCFLELSLLCPRFGVLIAPLFYLSKARQMFCIRRMTD